jgi:peptide/nickel transport system permease protein
MLRYTLRRVLWAIPTLFGVSILVFLLTTLLPEPPSLASLDSPDSSAATGSWDFVAYDRLEDERSTRFLDLPRFLNLRPRDVRTLATACVSALANGPPGAPLAAHILARLGGASFPYVLPELERLSRIDRGRVAVALAPVAERMKLGNPIDLADGERAARFWIQFWEDRALDFTEPSVRRAVRRLVNYGSEQRAGDLLFADTFILEPVIESMGSTADRVALERLSRVAVHVTGRGLVAELDATDVTRRRVVADWQEWWYVHAMDYVALDGAERIAATLGNTRYGKWAARIGTGHLGVSARDGEPIAPKLVSRMGITLLVTGVSMLASFALAVPIGVFAAWRRGNAIDTVIAVILFALYSLPTFASALLLARLFTGASALAGVSRPTLGTSDPRMVLAIVTLTLASLATLSRQQRSAMLEVVRQDYVRTARAKGVPGVRVLVVHALRNALVPTVTLASLQLPVLFGGAFVVEEVFGLQGLGYETLRAVEAHDAPWLMATILLAALGTTFALVLSDILHALLDPRVREAYVQRHGAVA